MLPSKRGGRPKKKPRGNEVQGNCSQGDPTLKVLGFPPILQGTYLDGDHPFTGEQGAFALFPVSPPSTGPTEVQLCSRSHRGESRGFTLKVTGREVCRRKSQGWHCVARQRVLITQMRSSWNEGEPSGYHTQQDGDHVSTSNSQAIYIIPQKALDYAVSFSLGPLGTI